MEVPSLECSEAEVSLRGMTGNVLNHKLRCCWSGVKWLLPKLRHAKEGDQEPRKDRESDFMDLHHWSGPADAFSFCNSSANKQGMARYRRTVNPIEICPGTSENGPIA